MVQIYKKNKGCKKLNKNIKKTYAKNYILRHLKYLSLKINGLETKCFKTVSFSG